MLNFNTRKRQSEPNMNSVVNGGMSNAADAAVPAEGGARAEELINSKISELEAQRREFMKMNPDFDMRAELEDPKFSEYIFRNGLSIEDAYFLIHRDEIISSEVQQALKKLSERRNRIVENEAGKNSAVVVKKNPSELSDKEIDSIIERVRNGEKISF